MQIDTTSYLVLCLPKMHILDIPNDILAEILTDADNLPAARVCSRFKSVMYAHTKVDLVLLSRTIEYPITFCRLFAMYTNPTHDNLSLLLQLIAETGHPESVRPLLPLIDSIDHVLVSDDPYQEDFYIELLAYPRLKFPEFLDMAYGLSIDIDHDMLLDACVNDSRYDPIKHGWNVVIRIAECGHVKTVRSVLDRGYKIPDLQVKEIMRHAASENKHRVLQLLLDRGYKTELDYDSVCKIVGAGYYRIVSLVSQHGLCSRHALQNLFSMSAHYNRPQMLLQLYKHADDIHLKRALDDAVHLGHQDIITTLLDLGVQPNERIRSLVARYEL